MNKDFQTIASKWEITSTPDSAEQFLEALAEKVYDLLLKDRKKLFTALYRLCISEERINRIFEKEDVLLIPFKIAEEILHRELNRCNHHH